MVPTSTFPPGRPARLLAATSALLFVAVGAVAISGRATAPLVRAIAAGRAPQAVALDPHGNHAFVLGADATVQLVDLVHARVLHIVSGDGMPRRLSPTLALDARTQRLFVADPRDGLGPSLVRMLDSRSGALRATVRVGLGAIALAVDERSGQVFVANQRDGSISVLDARTARVQRTISVGPAPVALAVDVRTARAFVVSDGIGAGHESDAAVSVLDTRTGSVVRTLCGGAGPISVVIDVRIGRTFVMNGGDGTVSVLDAHDGTLLRLIAVGGRLSALAVDERRGRVYVADAHDGTLSLSACSTRPAACCYARCGSTPQPAPPIRCPTPLPSTKPAIVSI